jgi:hypothetical protein
MTTSGADSNQGTNEQIISRLSTIREGGPHQGLTERLGQHGYGFWHLSMLFAGAHRPAILTEARPAMGRII